MNSVSNFLYRLPRFDIIFPIDFVPEGATEEGSIITGRCLNLSHTGLLGSFAYPLGEGTIGTVRLRPASRTFPLHVAVTHSEGLRSGLQFAFNNDQEKQVVRALVDAIASRSLQPR